MSNFTWDKIQQREDSKTLLLYRHERIFSEKLVKPGAVVLDVGGWGHLATRLVEEGTDCTILDLSPNATIRGLPHVTGDARDASTFLPGTFDLITCFETLQAPQCGVNVLSNLYQWLKPGGWLVGTVPLRFMDPAGMADALKAARFQRITTEPTPSIAKDRPVVCLYFKGRKRTR